MRRFFPRHNFQFCIFNSIHILILNRWVYLFLCDHRAVYHSSWKRIHCVGQKYSPKSKPFKKTISNLSRILRWMKHHLRTFSCNLLTQIQTQIDNQLKITHSRHSRYKNRTKPKCKPVNGFLWLCYLYIHLCVFITPYYFVCLLNIFIWNKNSRIELKAHSWREQNKTKN